MGKIRFIYIVPFILSLLVVPFVIKLFEYDCGYGIYMWHSDYAIEQDLYCYYRSRFFIVTALVTFILYILWRLKNKQENFYRLVSIQKYAKIIFFSMLLVYGMMSLICTVLSVNRDASIWGNFYSYQGVFVQLGYILLCIYTYSICGLPDVKKSITKLAILFLVLEIAIGYLEILGLDPIRWNWVQRLILGKKYQAYYGGLSSQFDEHCVALSFMNPNYAGLLLAMIEGMLTVVILTTERLEEKIKWVGLFVVVFPLLFFTYSRGALVALGGSTITCWVIYSYLLKMDVKINKFKIIKKLLLSIIALVVLFIVINQFDGGKNGKFINRLIDKRVDTKLEELTADEDGIHVVYDGETYGFIYNGKTFCEIEQKQYPFILLNFKFDGNDCVLLKVENMEYAFIYDGHYYFYLNKNGKVTTLDKVRKVDFGEFEFLGSGRLYIWSRTIPVLKDYWLYGSGFDTFPEVFPQDDYVGKYIYCKDPNMIIENPHNMFLEIAITMGILGLISFLGMIATLGYANVNNMKATKYRNGGEKTIEVCRFITFIGILSYLIGGFFYCSNLFVTPFFWCLMGCNAYYNFGDIMKNE